MNEVQFMFYTKVQKMTLNLYEYCIRHLRSINSINMYSATNKKYRYIYISYYWLAPLVGYTI
jgi:hypothetical protein